VRDYELSDLGRYERELHAYLRANHAEILKAIRESGNLSDDVESKLRDALDAFKGIFQPARRGGAAA
jgi:F-type H+-transporting ATPase subunit alpha